MLSLELMCVIYVITHVASGRKYVGQTVKKAKVRKKEHWNAAMRTDVRTYRNNQMYVTNALRKYGVDAFTFEVIEQCSSREELDVRETFWTRELKTLSPNGFNLREGPLGLVGAKIAAVVGKKISKANKGREKTPEWCAALSRSHTGKTLTPEHRVNIGKAQVGRKQSEETKRKRSLTLKGRTLGPYSEERKAAVKAGMARMTDEAKEQMLERNSKARTGKRRGPHSKEHCAKLAAAHLGMTHTDETKAKISAIQLGRKRGPYSEEHKAAARAGLIRYLESIGKRKVE